MIISGFFGFYLWRPWNWVALTVSMVTFAWVLIYMNIFLTSAEHLCLHPDDAPRVRVRVASHQNGSDLKLLFLCHQVVVTSFFIVF